MGQNQSASLLHVNPLSLVLAVSLTLAYLRADNWSVIILCILYYPARHGLPVCTPPPPSQSGIGENTLGPIWSGAKNSYPPPTGNKLGSDYSSWVGSRVSHARAEWFAEASVLCSSPADPASFFLHQWLLAMSHVWMEARQLKPPPSSKCWSSIIGTQAKHAKSQTMWNSTSIIMFPSFKNKKLEKNLKQDYSVREWLILSTV